MSELNVTSGRVFAWAGGSFLLFVAALFATLPLIAVFKWFPALSHLTEMALWSVVWGALSIVGVLVAGRMAFGGWLRADATAFAIAAIGIGISATVHVVLQQWAIARFGYYDPEFVWWTAGLFAVLVGLAVATFGVLVAPRIAVVWPLIATLAGAALVLFILATNIPGLRDGIAPESWPLAIWVGLSGVYAVATTLLAFRRAASQARD